MKIEVFLPSKGLSTKLVAKAWSKIKTQNSVLLSGAKLLRGQMTELEHQKAIAKYEAGSDSRKVIYHGLALTFNLDQACLIKKVSRASNILLESSHRNLLT